jgi:uncharacterized protein
MLLMTNIVDRTKNTDTKGKSVINKHKFLKRIKERLREAVRRSISERDIKDIGRQREKVHVPRKSIHEPTFRHGNQGIRHHVLPGNEKFQKGDRLVRPREGVGDGSQPGLGEDGEDDFIFIDPKDQWDIFFEELELPNLEERFSENSEETRLQRAGFSKYGPDARRDDAMTMRQSIARRIASKRPTKKEIEELERRIEELERKPTLSNGEFEELRRLREELELALRRRKIIPFVEERDLRFRRFEEISEPCTQAVMFCMMDISGSMDKHKKSLAKTFFVAIYKLLRKRYKGVEFVCLVHTTTAKEVDEEEFFHGRESGGTIVSSVLELMQEIRQDRYPLDKWNVYGAQISDGDNWAGDSVKCATMLQDTLLQMCQYYMYIEVADESKVHLLQDLTAGGELWKAYRAIHHDRFATARVTEVKQIGHVLQDLLKKKEVTQ